MFAWHLIPWYPIPWISWIIAGKSLVAEVLMIRRVLTTKRPAMLVRVTRSLDSSVQTLRHAMTRRAPASLCSCATRPASQCALAGVHTKLLAACSGPAFPALPLLPTTTSRTE